MKKILDNFILIFTITFLCQNSVISSGKIILEEAVVQNTKRVIGNTPRILGLKPQKFTVSQQKKLIPSQVRFLDETKEIYSTDSALDFEESTILKEVRDHTVTVKTSSNYLKNKTFQFGLDEQSITSSPFKFLAVEVLDQLFDRRAYVPTPHIFPWRIQGLIICEFDKLGIKSRGTGTLIGRNTVLTAAHCLYIKDEEHKNLIPASKVTFIAGLHGTAKSHLAVVDSDMYFTHEKYLDNDENFDYAVIKLNHNLGEKLGWASLMAPDENELQDMEISVTGYPAYHGFINTLRKKPNYDMYTMKGPITSVKKHKFYYRIDTSGGQSGAAVGVLDKNNIFKCMGVHVTGSKQEGNGAIRINEDNLNCIRNWLELCYPNGDRT